MLPANTIIQNLTLLSPLFVTHAFESVQEEDVRRDPILVKNSLRFESVDLSGNVNTANMEVLQVGHVLFVEGYDCVIY